MRETPPTTIPGWIVHEVANGTAVVQGPNGTWRVARGDVLPGAERVILSFAGEIAGSLRPTKD